MIYFGRILFDNNYRTDNNGDFCQRNMEFDEIQYKRQWGRVLFGNFGPLRPQTPETPENRRKPLRPLLRPPQNTPNFFRA